MSERPCRYCRAAWGDDADLCEFAHEDSSDSIAALARAFAVACQEPEGEPTDEQIGWFMEDADAVAADFDPHPARWAVSKSGGFDDEFVARFRINRRIYVVENGEGHCAPVRLSTLRRWQREADAAYG